MKRYAALEVANTLFRVTFKLKNLRLADSIMKGVTHNLAPESQTPFQNFPMSQQVTYKFFQGRIAVFNEEYVSIALLQLTRVMSHFPMVRYMHLEDVHMQIIRTHCNTPFCTTDNTAFAMQEVYVVTEDIHRPC